MIYIIYAISVFISFSLYRCHLPFSFHPPVFLQSDAVQAGLLLRKSTYRSPSTQLGFLLLLVYLIYY